MKIKDHKFWGKVQKAHSKFTCWEWLGAKDRYGYGRVIRRRVDEKPLKVHRYAFYLYYSRWPEGECIHACGNKACVKPGHLFDDVRRAEKQKPMLVGYLEGHVQEMQKRYVKGSRMNSVRGLAEDYGVHVNTMRRIVNGTFFENMYGSF